MLHKKISGIEELLLQIALIIFLAGLVVAQDIYFINGEPHWNTRDGKALPMEVYRLDVHNRILRKCWELKDDNMQISSIASFPHDNTILISTSSYLTKTSCFTLVMTDSAFSEQVFKWPDSLGLIARHQLFLSQSGSKQLEVKTSKAVYSAMIEHREPNNLTWEINRVGKADGKQNIVTTAALASLRLDGPGRLLVSPDAIVWTTILPDGSIVTHDLQSTIEGGPPIPDSIVSMKTSYGWNLIVAEPEFWALCSVPDRNGLTQRELLILNRQFSKWTSWMLPGNETEPRLVNGWLVGVIADSDPKTNWEKRSRNEPLLRDESVIIDPVRARMFIAQIGKQHEILWIQDSTAYYRIQDSLFSARIEKDDFRNRTLILTDPAMKHVHWAFRGVPSSE